jgi:hypothetical protein
MHTHARTRARAHTHTHTHTHIHTHTHTRTHTHTHTRTHVPTKVLLDNGVEENAIVFLNIISCPEGIKALTTKFPKIKIVTAEVDSHLNDKM